MAPSAVNGATRAERGSVSRPVVTPVAAAAPAANASMMDALVCVARSRLTERLAPLRQSTANCATFWQWPVITASVRVRCPCVRAAGAWLWARADRGVSLSLPYSPMSQSSRERYEK